jgi:Legume lectin domain
VNVQSFTNNFTFQLTNAAADGFTFTVQGVGPTALGPFGGALGYGPTSYVPAIASSVAVKFDLYDNGGEGNNSTGLYTDGASPTIPAITLGGGVNLHSGDVMQVQMSYDGTTLTMTITDATTAATFTTSWPINIPATVGGNTAYVGFTGGTGGGTADQQILTWTYAH